MGMYDKEPGEPNFPTFESAGAAVDFLESDPRVEAFRAILGAAEGAAFNQDVETAARLLAVAKERTHLLPEAYFVPSEIEKRMKLPSASHRGAIEGLCSLAELQLATTGKIKLPRPSDRMRTGPRERLY